MGFDGDWVVVGLWWAHGFWVLSVGGHEVGDNCGEREHQYGEYGHDDTIGWWHDGGLGDLLDGWPCGLWDEEL